MSDEKDREPRRVWCRGCNAEAFIPHPGTTEQGRKACRDVDERCTCEPAGQGDTEP